MREKGNGTPETCAANLMLLMRTEVPFDRLRGRDTSLIDAPDSAAADNALNDAEWVISTYEPRVLMQDASVSSSADGERRLLVAFKRKEGADGRD